MAEVMLKTHGRATHEPRNENQGTDPATERAERLAYDPSGKDENLLSGA